MGRKWNNIKDKKAAQDKARSKYYTRVLRDVAAAVKSGGTDIESNFSLKLALIKSREYNVPKDIVERAIKKATEDKNESWENLYYEGYGPDGVAIFIEALTNNPTRTSSNIKAAFNRGEGSLGKEGCLQFVFEQKAMFYIDDEQGKIDVDDLTMNLIDEGAEDVYREEQMVIVKAEPEAYGAIHKKLEELGIKVEESGLKRNPLQMKQVTNADFYKRVNKILDHLEDDEDVQEVYHNMEYNETFES